MESNSENFPNVLDKMVDHILAFDEIAFLDLVQQVWRRGWDIAAVPDPCDLDALRYALKACILERMAEIWSLQPKNRKTCAPAWCLHVSAVEIHFSVLRPEFAKFWDGETGSAIFGKRNIFAPSEFMFFL